MFSRRIIRRVVAAMACSWLFAQIALAAESCLVRLAAAPAQFSGDAMAMDDCAAAAAAHDTCLAHCLKSDQPASFSLDNQFQALPPALAAIGRMPELQVADSCSIPLRVFGSRGGPPLQVLFCSFQN